MTTQISGPFSRAWYGAPIANFLQTTTDTVLGQLASNSDFSIVPSQRDAWVGQIEILRSSLKGLTGTLLLEFNIPRMGRRIDCVLLIGPVVIVVEFKVGEKEFDRAAIDQVWDYALDLKNFHQASHVVSIVPILVATNTTESAPFVLQADVDLVYRPVQINAGNLRRAIELILQTVTGTTLNEQQWAQAPYHPTPTIVEAARCLYAQHSVEAIGGKFLTQQVGGGNLIELMEFFGVEEKWPDNTLRIVRQKMRAVGFHIERGEEWRGKVRFLDVGAVVYFLKAIPWLVDNFSVESHLEFLGKLQENLEREGKLEFTYVRFLISAGK